MSVPYSAPSQRPGMPGQPSAGVNLGLILPLAVTVLGLISYFCGFAQEVSGQGAALMLDYLLAGAVLAGASVLPKAGRGILVAATVLSVVPALALLQAVISSPGSVPSLLIVVLIAALLQAAAATAALLFDAEIIKLQPKPAPYGVTGGYGGFPPPPYGQQMGAYGQPGQAQSGAYGQPAQGQAAPGQAAQGQPGAYGQPGQAQPGAYGQPAQGQPGGYGQPAQGQPGGYGQPAQPQQGQFGAQQGQPGTPPGGVGGIGS